MKHWPWAMAAWTAILLGGCTTRAHVRNAPLESGLLRSYPAPFETVRKAASGALSEASLVLLEEGWADRGRWSILGASSSSPAARVFRLVVEDHPTDCRVWAFAESKPDVSDEALMQDLQSRIARLLGRKPIEARPPSSAAADLEGRYPTGLEACSEAAARACAALGYPELRRESADESLVTISSKVPAQGRLFVAIYRETERESRVVAEVRGGDSATNREIARSFHQALRKELGMER